jgi:hypothetical protein
MSQNKSPDCKTFNKHMKAPAVARGYIHSPMKWTLSRVLPQSPSAGGRIFFMLKSAWILLPVALAASAASAEIYKCQAKDGTALYQNFPCPINSLGSLPSVTAVAKTVPASGEATQDKASVAPAERRADAKTVVARGEPMVGMTADEIRSIWGEPENTYQDELVEGRVEIWSYGESRSVKFDVTGKVTAIRR